MLAPVDFFDAEALWILRYKHLDNLLKQLFAGIFAVALDLNAFGVLLGEEVVARRVDALVHLIHDEPFLEADLLQANGLVLCRRSSIEARWGECLLLLLDRNARKRDIGEIRAVTTVVLSHYQ